MWTEPQKTLNTKVILRRKNTVGCIMLSDFKLDLKAKITQAVRYWGKSRHTDHWNRTEGPGRNPHICNQLIHNKRIKNIT